VSVTFTPDNLGRITAITDQANNQLQYGFAPNGSLGTFTDFATNTTTFGYTDPEFPDLLTEITDTNGVHAITLTPTKAGN
jgi:YD repeat-containing protein